MDILPLQGTLAVPCQINSLPWPKVPGANVTSLTHNLANTGFNFIPEGPYTNNGAVAVVRVTYCNITVTYSLPNRPNNVTTVSAWLPMEWNGRLQGIGGSGWSAGLPEYGGMTAAVAQGYAAIATNSGLKSYDPKDWALLAPGVVDKVVLEHYASTSLNYLAIIGKSLVNSYYGEPPKYSYWNGCSQGGRQGLVLAQKYPTAFNGIAASAPPINWASLVPAGMWSQTVQHEMGKYIDGCEMSTLTYAAVRACDGNDGVLDGLISDPDSCYFDPFTLVNSTTNCLGYNGRVSHEAATLASYGWNGWNATNQTFLRDPMMHEASFVTQGIPNVGPLLSLFGYSLGLADSICLLPGVCTGKPFAMIEEWVRYFVFKDPSYDTSKIKLKEFDAMFETSKNEFSDIIGSDNPDLSEFRKAGGKILGYHGLADPLIPARNTRIYYDKVTAKDPKVHDFYRHFEAPGVGHCYSGSGLFPAGIFNSLIDWVEKGVVPNNLTVNTPAVMFTSGPGTRILCPYPQKTKYKGKGNSNDASSYQCV